MAANVATTRELATLVSRIRERGEGVTFGTGGTGPAMSDLAAGTVDAVIDQTLTMIPAHFGRTAVALAVTGASRTAQIPDVPAFA